MNPEIKVAGDSTSLKWLVEQCLKASPAIQLEIDRISIDWKKALSVAGFNDVASQRVLPFLSEFTQGWPLAIFKCGYERSLGQSRLNQTIVFPGKSKPLPKEMKDILKELLNAIQEFVHSLDMEGNFYRYELDFTLQIRGWELNQECEWLKMQLFPISYEVEYKPIHRLDVALATMANFITGESPISRNAPSPKDRAKIWQYANTLSELHFQLHSRLETLIQTLGNAATSEDCWIQLVGIIERMGKVEEKLASAMSCGHRNDRGYLNVFSIKETLRDKQRKSSLKVPDYWKDLLKDKPGTPMNSRGLRRWIENIRFHVLAFKNHAKLRQKIEFDEVLGSIGEFMKFVGNDLDWEIVEHSNQKPDPPELSLALDHVIRSHPLLTLLHSGFLTVYPPTPAGVSFYLGLSPWVIANIMARKCIGRPIMKYAGFGNAEEGVSDHAD